MDIQITYIPMVDEPPTNKCFNSTEDLIDDMYKRKKVLRIDKGDFIEDYISVDYVRELINPPTPQG